MWYIVRSEKHIILSFATTLKRHSRNQSSSGLCKKRLEREHVILNEVKDLVVALRDNSHCRNEILRCAQDDTFALRMTPYRIDPTV
jgi:hypothetical protein